MRLYSDIIESSDIRAAVPTGADLVAFRGIARPSEFNRLRGWTLRLIKSGWTEEEAGSDKYEDLLGPLLAKDPDLIYKDQ